METNEYEKYIKNMEYTGVRIEKTGTKKSWAMMNADFWSDHVGKVPSSLYEATRVRLILSLGTVSPIGVQKGSMASRESRERGRKPVVGKRGEEFCFFCMKKTRTNLRSAC